MQNAAQAAANILALNDWVASHPGSFNASLRSVRRWYAIRDAERGGWLVGFSKFIGYKGMTGHRYRLYCSTPSGSREPLNGRFTEDKSKPLWNQSAPVEEGSTLHAEILPYLLAFLGSQGLQKPRKDSSIRTLNGFAGQ
ncbi:MAG: hypothetical protein EOS23_04520 [Mesorhizobium sp.]|nr:MAG: hypothetical protein EOS23_04520 [Mesorhizobium sp.]